MHYPNGTGQFLIEPRIYQCVGIGLAYKSTYDNPRTIFHLGNHKRVGRRVAVLVQPEKNCWIRSMYPESDSQAGIKHKVGRYAREVTAGELEELLMPNFPLLSVSDMEKIPRTSSPG